MALVHTKQKPANDEPGKLWYIAVWGFSLTVFALLGIVGARWLLTLD